METMNINDGPTGRRKIDTCLICGQELISFEFSILGHLIWTRTHESCIPQTKADEPWQRTVRNPYGES